MSASRPARQATLRSQRPKATTVFAAAFLAGAAAAVGLNRTLDVHLAQRQPRVESEPIFVALRTLPQGAPVTVWDVALREWPKAMLPAAAMRPRDSFEGMVLRHPLREGQPILSVQLAKAATAGGDQVADATLAPALPAPSAADPAAQQADLWAPAEVPSPAAPPAEAVSQSNPPVITSEPPAAVRDPVAEVSQPLEPLPAHDTAAETLVDASQPPAEPISVAPIQPPSTVPEPVVAAPVVVAAPASTDIDAVTSPVAKATAAAAAQPSQAVRYLVVPERIALDADRSFVPAPAEDPPRAAAPESTARSLPKKPSAAPVQVQQGRASRPAERTSSSRDRQTQRPPRSAAGQQAPTKQPAKTSLLRSMMPTMSLGMGAVEPAPATGDKAEPKSGDTTEQPTRPAFRGLGLFR